MNRDSLALLSQKADWLTSLHAGINLGDLNRESLAASGIVSAVVLVSKERQRNDPQYAHGSVAVQTTLTLDSWQQFLKRYSSIKR